MTNEALSMAYKNLFGSEHGKTVLDDLDRYGFYNMPDRCFDAENERITSFNLGKLSMIRYIHGQIDKDLTEKQEKKAVHKEL